jgi:hypothetical protein
MKYILIIIVIIVLLAVGYFLYDKKKNEEKISALELQAAEEFPTTSNIPKDNFPLIKGSSGPKVGQLKKYVEKLFREQNKDDVFDVVLTAALVQMNGKYHGGPFYPVTEAIFKKLSNASISNPSLTLKPTSNSPLTRGNKDIPPVPTDAFPLITGSHGPNITILKQVLNRLTQRKMTLNDSFDNGVLGALNELHTKIPGGPFYPVEQIDFNALRSRAGI